MKKILREEIMSTGISRKKCVWVYDCNGEIVRYFDSVTGTIFFLLDRHGGCWHTMCERFYRALRSGDPLFGLMFRVVPNYVRERAMMSVNTYTGVSFVTHSVNEMAVREYSLDDVWAVGKVCHNAINGTPTPNGNILSYIGDRTGVRPNPFNGVRRPVFRLDISTGDILEHYFSVSSAARWVRHNELCRVRTSAPKVSCHIIRCAKGHQRCRSAYGFKWRYVEDHERPENIPLPESDDEGL